MKRGRALRIVVWLVAAAALLAVLAGVGGFLLVQSGWFHEYVRMRIVSELERATGARVEVDQFSFDSQALSARVAPLVLHGKESTAEPPLLRIERVTLGLRILSVMERKVDLASLRVERPHLRIVTYPDGSTNLPKPGGRLNASQWPQRLLDLAVRDYQVNGGVVEINQQQLPLNLRGQDLQLRMSYDARTPSYQCQLEIQRLRVAAGKTGPVDFGVSAQFAIEPERFLFTRLKLATKESRADLTGELRDLSQPRGAFSVNANAAMREMVRVFALPIAPAGSAAFDGRLSFAFAGSFHYDFHGQMTARGIGYAKDRIQVESAELRAVVDLTPDLVRLTNVQSTALGAKFAGSASLQHKSKLHVEGTIEGLTLDRAAKFATDRALPWNGVLAGPVSLDATDATVGRPDVRARADLSLSPAGKSAPVEGRINVAFDQAAGNVSLDSSYVSTPTTRLEASGTLDQDLDVRFRSTNPDDVLPALALLDPQAPREIPLKLNNGSVEAEGRITGRWEQARFLGHISVSNGIIQGHRFDQFSGDIAASRDSIAASRFTLKRGAAEASGNASVTARPGRFEDAAIAGQVVVANANVGELLAEAASPFEAAGTASATVRVSGSLRQPQAEIGLDVQKASALGELLDRVRANVRVSPESVAVSNGEAQAGPGRLRFSGTYQRAAVDWKSGDVQLQLAIQNLPASRLQRIARLQPAVDGRVSSDVRLRGKMVNGNFTLASADGTLEAQSVRLNNQPVGEFSLSGTTRGSTASVKASGKLLEASFEGQGSWKLEGDEPGAGAVQFSRMSLESFHRLMMLAGAAPQSDPLPFEGFLQGRVSLTLPLLHPKEVRAEATLDTVQLNPRNTQALKLNVQPQDLVVRNSQPVDVVVTAKEARLRPARFTARNSNLEVSGTIPFAAGSGANLAVQGSINLIILQLFNPNLLARGNATVQASLRGSLANPALNGRMELKGASLYLNDIPNGIDNVNGVVLFDRNRATIEKLAAETGGGTVAFGGFVEFGSLLTYRLQAQARQIRVRWPEDLSTTFDANLALNGTSDASTLTGTLTLDRAALTLRSDLIQLISASARPVPAPAAPNDYLRGMQFNVQVESAPNFSFETSLTRGIEAAVDLRLRGSPLRPILLGTIDVSQGRVTMFGNEYSIDRGNIRFLNPVKIEPTFDMQLQTRARGVTVTVSLAGTTQKLNVNYSSDPPLQQSEIIALLAVGRDPNLNPGLASAQTNTAATGSFVEAGGGLLSQAVSAQLSSRFQRFFGSSRVKIDPTMTGVDNLPQARLTWEQQVSRDITLTYITNLNRTQEQIVRLEWALDRNWSAVAVRDANGLFGIDFQYRKRFK